MPVVDNVVASPYPLTSEVLDRTRTRINDTMNDLSGDLLTNDAPYTNTLANIGWSWITSKWRQSGGEPFKKEVTILGFPSRATDDVINQCYLGQMASSDGVNVFPENNLLPMDMINPMDVYRRMSATVPGNFCRMTLATQGLPRWLDCNVYDWRESGGLFFYGEVYPQDFQIRYQAQWPDLNINNPNDRVMIVGCENCLSARIGYEFTNRLKPGGAGAQSLMQSAEDEFQLILQRTSRRENRKNLKRIPYGGRRHHHFYGYIPQY